MIKTVLFFVPSPFVARDYQRYGMELFANNGFQIFVWDFTPFLFPNLAKVIEPMEWHNLVVFDNETDVVSTLDRFSKDSFIFTSVPYGIKTLNIYRAISRRRIPYCVTVTDNLPPLPAGPGKKNAKRLGRITPTRLASYFIRRIPLRIMGVRPATFVLAEGAKCPIARAEVTSETQIVRAHSLDYNIYLNLGKEGAKRAGTAVFLDSFLPFHPDSLCLDDEPRIKPSDYYPPLLRFLDEFERQTRLTVVIAAHPRSDYSKTPDIFGKRVIKTNMTAELVKNATAVITEISTSISFAVLYRKPIVFVTTAALEKLPFGKYPYHLAAWFGKSPIRIDQDLDIDVTRELFVDEDAYANYQNSYIKMHGTEELQSWQILCNRIKQMQI